MLLGAIADDLTGATDLALTLSREGMRTVQVVGVPPVGFDYGDAEAVVLALKSRTIPAAEAVAMSLQALERLQQVGARQIIFKYCSTFDSTPEGNIGPVTQALLASLGEELTIVCPAFPTNGRTIYRGHLFVGDMPLSESPMKDHPLTPMTDSSLVRLMQAQTTLPVGLVTLDTVTRGPQAIREAFAKAKAAGTKVLVIDAISDDDLRSIGAAVDDMKLITGGSGIAIGLPENFRKQQELTPRQGHADFDAPAGRAIMLAGSCSKATRGQIQAAIEAGTPTFKIDPLAINAGTLTPAQAIEWADQITGAVPLIYSSADPEIVRAAQAKLGRDRAGELVEHFLGSVATALRDKGFTRFLVAGGETSGAVVGALGVSALFIGPEIDPGVPWTRSLGDAKPVALALKSGNFGADDFFSKAWRLLK
ncbi:four-carbon acid sugar kinase family protein [Rhizobium sp. CG5]|uniref:3-oxo-tetronate kinase n=1 Tax=Rhizobium sp. CG5 TaxID=2726076 RepID=UPI002033A6CD|nr:3-oxo-tetronate kinase [Rhizobium sp. CG5]MCM2475410.1 four-carbon acid sugar kinase family protein [Rhizobium sp. CG5]